MKYLKLYSCQLREHDLEEMETFIREEVNAAAKKHENLEIHDYKIALAGASVGGEIAFDGGSQYAQMEVLVGVVYSK